MTERYRKIDTRIRADAKFQALSAPPPNARDLWLFLLTCGHDRSIPGLHAVGLAQLADEMGWSTEATRRVWGEIESQGMAKADWRARVVWIPNALAYNRPQSINVVRSWRRAWGEISECSLKAEARTASAKVIAEKTKTLADAFLELCPAPKLNDSAQESIADASEKHKAMLSTCFSETRADEIETHDHQAPSTKHQEDLLSASKRGADREDPVPPSSQPLELIPSEPPKPHVSVETIASLWDREVDEERRAGRITEQRRAASKRLVEVLTDFVDPGGDPAEGLVTTTGAYVVEVAGACFPREAGKPPWRASFNWLLGADNEPYSKPPRRISRATLEERARKALAGDYRQRTSGPPAKRPEPGRGLLFPHEIEERRARGERI